MGLVIDHHDPEVSCWPRLFVAMILNVMLARPLCVLVEVESTRAIALMILEVLGFGFGFAGGFRVSPRSQCLPPSASHAEFRGAIVGSFAGAILALAFAPRCRVLFFCFHCVTLFVSLACIIP